MTITSPITHPLFAERPRRRSPLMVSMTIDERDAVRGRAERVGITMSEYSRRAIAEKMLRDDLGEHENAA